MILIAAIGIGIAGWQARVARQSMSFIWWGLAVQHYSIWLVTALCLALLAIRLRKPRLSARRLTCQPGWMACLAVAVTLALRSIEETEQILFMLYKRGLKLNFAESSDHLADLMMMSAPFAVAAIWAGLVIGRRWRPEPGWIEPAGIILGCSWVGLGTIGWICTAMPDFLSLWK